MNEITEAVAKTIEEYIKKGKKRLSLHYFERAIASYKSALSIVPPTKNDFKITAELKFLIGEAHYLNNNFEKAYNALMAASMAEGGMVHTMRCIRLGQIYYHTGDLANAVEFFLQAYFLEGEEAFNSVSSEYFDFLKHNVDL